MPGTSDGSGSRNFLEGSEQENRPIFFFNWTSVGTKGETSTTASLKCAHKECTHGASEHVPNLESLQQKAQLTKGRTEGGGWAPDVRFKRFVDGVATKCFRAAALTVPDEDQGLQTRGLHSTVILQDQKCTLGVFFELLAVVLHRIPEE